MEYPHDPASDYVLSVLSSHLGRRHEGFVIHHNGGPLTSNLFGYQWRRATQLWPGEDRIRQAVDQAVAVASEGPAEDR